MLPSVRVRTIPLVVFLLAIASAAATEELPPAETIRPPAPFGDKSSAEDSRWLRDPHSGCQVFYQWDIDAITEIVWSGSCVDGRASGTGSLKIIRERWTETFSGNFVNGRLEGEGSIDSSDGSYRVSGVFHQGILNGDGKSSWSSGMHYEGNYLNHGFRGKGKLTWPGGDTFDGFFVGWPDRGKGTLIYADGWQFRGDFINDVPVGDVIVYKPDNTRVEGNFIAPHPVTDSVPLNPTFSSTLLSPTSMRAWNSATPLESMAR
jgi:hypothetical protein